MAIGTPVVGSATGTWANNASVTPTAPTHSTGDLLVVVWCARGDKVPSSNPPTDWNSGPGFNNANSSIYVYWKIAASGSETMPSITKSSTTGLTVGVICFAVSGVDTATPFDVSPASATVFSNSQTNSGTLAAETTATDGAMAFYVQARNNDLTAAGTPSGWTELWDGDSTLGTDGSMSGGYKTVATAGSTGTVDVAITGGTSTDDGIGFIFALKPAGAATLERSAAASASSGVATAATFFSTFERSLAAAAASGVAVSGVAWTTFDRQVAAAGASGVATAAEFFTPAAVVERSVAASAASGAASVAEFFSVEARQVAASATAATVVAGQVEASRQVAASAVSSVATSGVGFTVEARQVAASAVSAATVAAIRDVPRAATVSGVTGVSVAAEHFSTLTAAVTASASSSVATAGQIEGAAATVERSAAASAATSVSAVGERVVLRSVTVAAVSAVATSSSLVAVRQVAASASSGVAVAGSKLLLRQVVATGTCLVVTAGRRLPAGPAVTGARPQLSVRTASVTSSATSPPRFSQGRSRGPSAG